MGTSETVQMLLPPNQTNPTNEVWEKAFSMWKQQTTQTSKPEVPIYQSNWDKELIKQRYQEILHTASIEEKARLLAVSSPSSSDWLHAVPIPSLGLKLDPMSLKIACGLRLGSTLCHPYKCKCGVTVEAMAYPATDRQVDIRDIPKLLILSREPLSKPR